MSLVITSNIGQEDDPEFSNVFKPFSYQNRLLNTMRIPPMSEIALQSAKINKNGLFILDRNNSGFCHYFGTPVEDLYNDNIENSTTQPFRAVIGTGEAFRAGDRKNEVNIDDMANEIKKGIDQATFHPSLITSATTTGVTVDPLYDGTTAAFKGFQFVSTCEAGKTTRNAADITFTDVSKNNSYNFSQAAGKVTSSDVRGFYVQNREYPISQNAGTCTFNFSDAQTGTNPNWMVGLSRINKERNLGLGEYDLLPNYFDDTPTSAALKTPIFIRGQYVYADICVMRYAGELRVFQSGARTAAGTGGGIYMNEVIYYGGHNTNFNTVYDIGQNGNNYRKVKFTLTNEELKIELIDNVGASVLLCDYTTLRGAGAVKNQCLNPVNAAKWAMYPVCSAGRRGANAHVDQVIELESIDHYTNYPSYNENQYINYDWWGWSQDRNQTVFCKELEMRDWNNHSRTTTNHGVAANGLLAPKGISNASGALESYESIIITARSSAYGNSTDECNTQFSLGFSGDPISRPTVTSNDLVFTNKSSSVPQLVSNVSLFIRLNNLTQNTINARQGTLSKIVGHLPRFDNSGNETGGLYFEPHEKTYLALNNPTELLINSFDVDIVYDNETLCTALTGKTVVCFHIRQQK